MKCKNCGSNYKTIELKCPYCHTENIIGKLWMAERSEAELEYEKQRKAIGKKSSAYVIDRILTRSILIIICIFIVVIIGMFGYAWIADKVINIRNNINKDKIEAKLHEYYVNEEYEKMYAYMHDEQLDLTEGYYGYTQAALLTYYYNEYLNHKYSFLSMTPEEQLEDDYHLEYSIRDSVKVYQLDCGIYDEVDPMNTELYEEYQKEVLSFWIGTLRLTDEEVADLSEEGRYLYSDELEALVSKVKERCIDVSE